MYTPNDKFTLWSAISRAIRTPARSETTINATLPSVNIPGTRILGSGLVAQDNVDAEVTYTYEAGLRYLAGSKWSFDVSTFYSKYSELLSTAPGMIQIDTSTFPPSPFIPVSFQNNATVDNYGAEAVIDFVPTSWLNLRASYSHIRFHSNATDLGANATAIPENMANLRASFSLPSNVDFDINYRFMDSVALLGVEAYNQLDIRLAKQITKNVLLELVGRNLIHERQAEFSTAVYTPLATSLQREFFARITWILG